MYKCNQVEGRRERIIRRSTTPSTPSLIPREPQGKGDVEEVIKDTTKIIIMKAKEAIIMTDTTRMMPRSTMHGRCPKTISKEDGTSTKVRPRQLITTTRAASNLKTTKKASKKQV